MTDPEIVHEVIRERIARRREIFFEERGPSNDLAAFKQACQACETVVEWYEIIATRDWGSSSNADETIPSYKDDRNLRLELCPDCYFLFRTDFEERDGASGSFVDWRRHFYEKTDCRWCGSTLDHSVTYCRKCGRT